MKPNLSKLVSNHMDAWGVAFGISIMVLVLHNAITLPGVILALGVTVSYRLGFALNDFFDAEVDRHDRRKASSNFFVRQNFPRRVVIAGFCLIVLACTALFASFGPRGLLVCLPGYSIMWAYSAPPLRLKGRPVADLVVHALFVETYPYVVMLFMLGLPLLAADTSLLAIFLLTSLTAQLEQQLRDYELDRQFDKTFTTRFGPALTMTLLRWLTALLLVLVLLMLVAGFIPLVLLPFGLVMLPVILHRFARSAQQSRSEALVRVALVMALLYTSVLWVQHIFI